MTLEEITAKATCDTEASIKAAFYAGVEEGRRLAKIEILNVLTSERGGEVLGNWKKGTAPSEPDMFHPTAAQIEDARRRVAKRAPKGLTKRVLRQVFNEHPDGLKMEGVQDAAVAIDGRISRKTVYNELYRRTEAYTKGADNLWRPRSPIRGGKAPWITTQPEGGLQ